MQAKPLRFQVAKLLEDLNFTQHVTLDLVWLNSISSLNVIYVAAKYENAAFQPAQRVEDGWNTLILVIYSVLCHNQTGSGNRTILEAMETKSGSSRHHLIRLWFWSFQCTRHRRMRPYYIMRIYTNLRTAHRKGLLNMVLILAIKAVNDTLEPISHGFTLLVLDDHLHFEPTASNIANLHRLLMTLQTTWWNGDQKSSILFSCTSPKPHYSQHKDPLYCW